jgi:hypothetical protein
MKPAVQRAMFVGVALLGALAVYAVLDATTRGVAMSRNESPVEPYQTGFACR